MLSIDDFLILANSLGCFFLFAFLQLVIFRFLGTKEVLKMLMILIIGAGFLNILISLINFYSRSLEIVFVVSLSSLVLYGLMAFLYIICIFGPYESSVRLRIIRELYKVYPSSITLAELLKEYNSQKIIDRRLQRLTFSNDITWDGIFYQISRKKNFFLISDKIAACLKILTKT